MPFPPCPPCELFGVFCLFACCFVLLFISSHIIEFRMSQACLSSLKFLLLSSHFSGMVSLFFLLI